MNKTQVKVSVQYYEMDGNRNRTGKIIYEGTYAGSPEVVRSTLKQLAANTNLSSHEAEYSISGTISEMPTPLDEWWDHLLTDEG